MSEMKGNKAHKEHKERKEKSYAGVTKFMLIMRLVVAAYLVYLSCTLLQAYFRGEGLPLYILVIAVTVFTGFAVFAAVFSVKALLKGEYSGGRADTCIDDNKDTRELESVDIKQHTGAEQDGKPGTDAVQEGVLLSERLKKYNK